MSDKHQQPALMDEYPLLVYPSLAKAMGINTAVVFQQLHFLMGSQKTAKNEYTFIGGRWWVYNSYAEWHENYFSWLAPVTLKGIFRELEAKKLVLTMQSVKNKSDRRKWYTIDYEAWELYQKTIGQKVSDQPTDKKYPMVGSKVSDGYSDTTSETTKGNTSAADATGTKKDTPKQSRNNPNFDAVCEYVFKINPKDVGGEGGRIGPIAAWLNGKSDGMKRSGGKVGYISKPAEPQHVQLFAKYWKQKYNDASMPLDFVKFVEAWRAWASTKREAKVYDNPAMDLTKPVDFEPILKPQPEKAAS